jgi:hypothetical protein
MFTPLIADLKEPQFQASYLGTDSPVLDRQIGAIGLGETFGLVRWPGRRRGDGWQIDLSGGVFSQFEIGAQSTDLVNADYVVGLPVTYRRGSFSTRLALHHQSSHLGDEYLLRENPERLNVSYDGIQLLLSHNLADWRLYAGGDYVFVHAPQPMKDGVFQTGVGTAVTKRCFTPGPRSGSRGRGARRAVVARAGFAAVVERPGGGRARAPRTGASGTGPDLEPAARSIQGTHTVGPVLRRVDLVHRDRAPLPLGHFFSDPPHASR